MDYDKVRYGRRMLDKLQDSTQFTTGVVVQRSRILRTRAMFDTPWSQTFTLDCDDELVDHGPSWQTGWISPDGGSGWEIGDQRSLATMMGGSRQLASLPRDSLGLVWQCSAW